ncbi:MAG: glycoside hydrolase family 16 protein [Planctomycetota bacterium]
MSKTALRLRVGLLAAGFVSVSGVAGTSATAAGPPAWTLVWSDDFNRLDTTKWSIVSTNKPTNNSLQDYLPQQVSVRRGKLIILAEDVPSRGLGYRSGQVISKAEQKHGRWEVRAKLPATRGMWPAIWLLPDVDRYPWPSGGEIDIVENRGDAPHITSSAFHFGTREPYLHEFVFREQKSAHSRGLANYHRSFHNYAVEWTEDQLRFFVDDVNHYTVYDDEVKSFLSRSTQPMQLVINNAIGGDFLDDPDGTTDWPQKMEIDWVRVYQEDTPSISPTLTNGDFEAYGGTLQGWSVFGRRVHDSPNVCVANTTPPNGSPALKLFGRFAGEPSYSGVSQGVAVEAGSRVVASVQTYAPSWDSIRGSSNAVSLKLEFYSELNAKYGGSAMLAEDAIAIADASTPEDSWQSHELAADAPAGAVEARVAIVFHQPNSEPGAVYCDNVSLQAGVPAQ